jgi:dihydroflavonol-4-reductase
MRAFITGSTGFIGQHLVRELLAHGYEVSALVRTFERAQRLPAGVRVVPGDVTKPDSLRPGLREADVVFHAAGLHQVGLRPRDQARMQRTNVDGARHVLALAAEAGATRIVHVSNIAVYGDTRGQAVDEACHADTATHVSHYQRTTHQAHFEVAAALQKAGAPVIITPLGAVYGPGDLSTLGRLLRLHARRRLWVGIGPDNARAWTYVEDAALGLRLAAERGIPGETYHLAGPAHTFLEFFEACARSSRAPAPYAWVPSAWARFLARALTQVLPAPAERLRSISGVTHLARSNKAQEALGWRARPLAEGLPPTFAALEDR